MQKNYNDLESNSFSKYPHYVYCTAFLVEGELADYNIGSSESCWGLRTFIGTKWERDIINSNSKLTCEYKKIFVNNSDEHDKAFEDLEDWLFDNFKIYSKSGVHRIF